MGHLGLCVSHRVFTRYIPDVWESRLAGPYGTAPNGYVPLGVGPGGPNRCVQNAPEPLPNLTLTSAPEMKPPGLSGYTDAPLLANVKKAGAPLAGVPITFAINVLAHSGQHEHHDNQRPLVLDVNYLDRSATTILAGGSGG